MGSQSENINCKNTVALTNMSKCNMFTFDVTLEISYLADVKWKNDSCLWKTILTTITCQIGHKYKNWKRCNCIMTISLFEKFLELKPSSTEWKGTISVAGQFAHRRFSCADYSEIIYDWFSYDGFMTVPELPKGQHEPPSVYLQYTIRFLLNPALPIAQYIYRAKGYEKILHDGAPTDKWTVDHIKKYMNIIRVEVDHEKEYNHLEIWQKAWNAYKPPTPFNSMRRIH